MKLELFFTAHEISEERLKERSAVVVDVLRASTTICAALAAGAKEIIPAESVSAAIQLMNNLSRDAVLLCGEREGKLISGFDLSNSPFEYTPALVKGKTLIFASTNGSPTITHTRSAHHTYICGFVNLSQVVNALLASKWEIAVFCSGKLGQFAIEDAVCAGNLIHELELSSPELELNDAAAAAVVLYDKYRDQIPEVVADSHHGRYLTQIGMQADLPVCADLNRIPVLPVFRGGKITAQKATK